jgi:Fe-S-cluster containining protein
MAQETPVPRSCGECNACCKVFPVPEVGKHDTDWCQHCKVGTGCGIYDTRPKVCRDYECVWLKGSGDESHRPDRFGILLNVREIELSTRKVRVLHLFEIQAGALEKEEIKSVVEGYVAAGNIICYHLIRTPTEYDMYLRFNAASFTIEEFLTLRSKDT